MPVPAMFRGFVLLFVLRKLGFTAEKALATKAYLQYNHSGKTVSVLSPNFIYHAASLSRNHARAGELLSHVGVAHYLQPHTVRNRASGVYLHVERCITGAEHDRESLKDLEATLLAKSRTCGDTFRPQRALQAPWTTMAWHRPDFVRAKRIVGALSPSGERPVLHCSYCQFLSCSYSRSELTAAERYRSRWQTGAARSMHI
jgi:hypothetical protein